MKYKLIVLGVVIFSLWSFWELFHCSYHIFRDHSLLDLPGVKLMMVKKAFFFLSAVLILIFSMRKIKKAI